MQIHHLLANTVFPMILDSYSGKKIPKNFQLDSAYIEYFGAADASKSRIWINEDTGITISYKKKSDSRIMKTHEVTHEHVSHFVKFERPGKNPNAATITLVRLRNEWFGQFDLVYNRRYVSEKLGRAVEFFDSSIANLRAENYNAFYQSLWDCYELLMECVLLLHNQIKLRADHKAIRESFSLFCQSNNTTYNSEYEEIKAIREHARYGPPHPENRKMVQKANRLLLSTREMLQFTVAFLEKRQVLPDEDTVRRMARFQDLEG